jgi:hypothetical protein
MEYLKRMRTTTEDGDSLEDLDRKIMLLEKIIAG